MIPTLIVIGILIGGRWKVGLVSATIAWIALLVVGDVVDVGWQLPGVAGLAAMNLTAGVLIHQMGRRLVGHRRSRTASRPSS